MTPRAALLALLVASCGGTNAATPHAPPALEAPAAPASLEGFRLTALDAHGDVYGPLAFTTLRFTFAPQAPAPPAPSAAPVREVGLAVVLPVGASVARVAVNGEESALVSIGSLEDRAAVAWVPAAGDSGGARANVQIGQSATPVRTRVFQARVRVPAGPVEVTIGYEEALLDDYRLPLIGHPRLARVDASVTAGARTVAIHARDAAPDHDLTAPLVADAVRGGDFAVVRFSEPAPGEPAAMADVAVLVDSSASAMRGYAEHVDAAAALLARAGIRPRFVAAFDQEVAPLAALTDAKARHPAGATNIAAALGWAAQRGAKRAILVTDGLDTVDSAMARAEMRGSPLARVDVLATRLGDDNLEALHRRAECGQEPGAIVALDAPPADAIAALTSPRGMIARASVLAANATYPTALSKTGALASDALAFVEFAAASPSCHCGDVIYASRDGAAATPIAQIASAPAWLVERAVAEARIRELDRDRFRHRDRIVALALRHRILTPLTAFRAPGTKSLLLAADADRDADGIPDAADKCPLEPEQRNGYEDDDGCPDHGQVFTSSSYDFILQPIYFWTGLSRIEPASNEVLDQYATLLQHHPEFELAGAFGHAAADEPAAVGEARARAVRDALIARGIPAARLVARGFGATRPMTEGKTPDERAKNRRVELRILIQDDVAYQGDSVPDVPGLIRHGKALPTHEPLSSELNGILDNVVQNAPAAARARIDACLEREPTDPRPWLALGALPSSGARA